jgi:hypothetical protein
VWTWLKRIAEFLFLQNILKRNRLTEITAQKYNREQKKSKRL